MSSQKSAEQLWRLVTEIKPSEFAGFNLMIEESARPDQTFYRVQTGPFSSFAQAKLFCQTLLDNQIRDCIPLKRQF